MLMRALQERLCQLFKENSAHAYIRGVGVLIEQQQLKAGGFGLDVGQRWTLDLGPFTFCRFLSFMSFAVEFSSGRRIM